MGQNLKIDPTTKDYVLENGSPTSTDRVLEACYMAIMIPQNKYLYGQAGQGSLIYTLNNIKRTRSVEQIFASCVTDAIQRQVIQTGQATKVAVSNILKTRYGTSNQIDVTETNSKSSSDLEFVSV